MYSRYYRCIAQKKIERGKAQPALSWPKPPPSHTPTMAPHISTSSTHNTPAAAIPLSPISHSRWQPERRKERRREKRRGRGRGRGRGGRPSHCCSSPEELYHATTSPKLGKIKPHGHLQLQDKEKLSHGRSLSLSNSEPNCCT